MSARDFRTYEHIARRIVGHQVQFSVAANSLKLGPKAAAFSGRYIWIDPPWSLWEDTDEIVNGGDAPQPEDPAYRQHFEVFCDRLECLRDSTLEDIRFVGDETTEFVFEGGLRLVVWHQEPESGDEYWYDDWYAKDEE